MNRYKRMISYGKERQKNRPAFEDDRQPATATVPSTRRSVRDKCGFSSSIVSDLSGKKRLFTFHFHSRDTMTIIYKAFGFTVILYQMSIFIISTIPLEVRGFFDERILHKIK